MSIYMTTDTEDPSYHQIYLKKNSTNIYQRGMNISSVNPNK